MSSFFPHSSSVNAMNTCPVETWPLSQPPWPSASTASHRPSLRPLLVSLLLASPPTCYTAPQRTLHLFTSLPGYLSWTRLLSTHLSPTPAHSPRPTLFQDDAPNPAFLVCAFAFSFPDDVLSPPTSLANLTHCFRFFTKMVRAQRIQCWEFRLLRYQN